MKCLQSFLGLDHQVHPILYPFIYADECFPGGCIFILAIASELPGSVVKTDTVSINTISIDTIVALIVIPLWYF